MESHLYGSQDNADGHEGRRAKEYQARENKSLHRHLGQLMTAHSCHHSGTKTECHEGPEEAEVTMGVDGQGLLPKATGLEVHIGFREE